MTEAVAKQAGTGLRNVAVSESRISSIDGERGILAYRGIDIHELAAASTFEETSFLLHEGRLPRRSELAEFTATLGKARGVEDGVLAVARQMPRHTHPMTTLRTLVSALGAFGKDADDDSPEAVLPKSRRLIAQMATLVAALDRIRRGLHPVAPDPGLSHAANFLYMLRGERPSESAARSFDAALVLHADHEFNASTFAARVAASTLADVHGAITAAVRSEEHTSELQSPAMIS